MDHSQHNHSHTHVETSFWDRLGIGLSALCAIHCAVIPLAMASMPLVARSWLDQPLFHIVMAVLILPIGLWAFISGYRHHRQARVLFLGIPGLIIVCLIPPLFHHFELESFEVAFMLPGSALLIVSHWINQRACKHC